MPRSANGSPAWGGSRATRRTLPNPARPRHPRKANDMTFWPVQTGVDHTIHADDPGRVPTPVLVAGAGDALVMLHGTSGHLEAFVRNFPALSPYYALHAIDMMGHGYTDGPDAPYRI